MIASQHRKGDGEIVYPFNDFLHVINEVRNVTRDEEKADEMAKEASLLTTVMIQSEIDRGKDIVDFVKTKDIKNNWILIDATNAIVGRLAVFISKTIRGKNKSNYTPHMDHGDFIIVKNVEKIKFTGNKFKNKKYFTNN